MKPINKSSGNLKFKSRFLWWGLWVALALFPAAAKEIPIILDTDLGTDVDDAYALVLAAKHPDFKLLGVLVLNGKTEVRAAIAKKMLVQMGKDKVPVAAGVRSSRFWGGWEGKGVLEDKEQVPGISEKSASDLLIELLKKQKGKVILCPVGGLSNIAAALKKDPSIKDKIEKLVIMGGCIYPITVQGQTIPSRMETNLHNDVEAAAFVLKAGIPIRLVPAEVTFKTKLLKPDFARIKAADSALAKSIVRMTEIWEPIMKQFMISSKVDAYYHDGHVMLHDPLAVATLVQPSMVKMKRTRMRVETGKDSIKTIEDPNGDIPIELVVEADNDALSRLMADLVLR